MAEDENQGAGEQEQQTAAPDLSFIPENFKDEAGGYKVDDFKTHYGELASFKAQADEAKAALPETADGYAWALPEDFAFAEGFDPTQHQVPVLDDDGKPVMENGVAKTRDYEPADMLDTKDPDLALLQGALHEHGADPALAGKPLGPDAQSRIDVVKRSLSARLPAAQAAAVLQDITSADALRGIEAMIKSSTVPPNAANNTKLDNATASIDDRIMTGLRGR